MKRWHVPLDLQAVRNLPSSVKVQALVLPKCGTSGTCGGSGGDIVGACGSGVGSGGHGRGADSCEEKGEGEGGGNRQGVAEACARQSVQVVDEDEDGIVGPAKSRRANFLPCPPATVGGVCDSGACCYGCDDASRESGTSCGTIVHQYFRALGGSGGGSIDAHDDHDPETFTAPPLSTSTARCSAGGKKMSKILARVAFHAKSLSKVPLYHLTRVVFENLGSKQSEFT